VGIPLELFWEAETMNDVDTPDHLLETDLS
jgi:hypothetical protein